jgi:hypothetical protein
MAELRPKQSNFLPHCSPSNYLPGYSWKQPTTFSRVLLQELNVAPVLKNFRPLTELKSVLPSTESYLETV